MLAQKLNMESDDAERWIVNLIRNAKLDAKIDSQLGHVVMGTQTTSPLEQVMLLFTRAKYSANHIKSLILQFLWSVKALSPRNVQSANLDRTNDPFVDRELQY